MPSVRAALALLLATPACAWSAPDAAHALAASEAAPLPTWTLPVGLMFPTLTLNTASLSVEQTAAVVEKANALGITSVDFHLGNERKGVTRALATLGRDALFLVTKLDKPPADMTDPQEAAQLARTTLTEELSEIGSVDVLLLKDSATCEVMQAQWAVLEHWLDRGLAKALGTYNYCPSALDCLLATAKTPPALNFLMRHPGMGPDTSGDIAYSESKGVRVVTYGTLGEPIALPKLLYSTVLSRIGASHDPPRTPEEVALRWNTQAGYAVTSRPTADYNLTSSFCFDDCHTGLSAMRATYDWALTPSEVAAIDALIIATPPQPATYYASSGCPTFDPETAGQLHSACLEDQASSRWCN